MDSEDYCKQTMYLSVEEFLVEQSVTVLYQIVITTFVCSINQF
jgi:hypothetical protein